MKFSDIAGIIVVIVIVAAVVSLVRRVNEVSEPCYPRNIERRQVLIESHEQCMSEANCIYEDWDIRKYDDRLEMQVRCEANRNED